MTHNSFTVFADFVMDAVPLLTTSVYLIGQLGGAFLAQT